MAKPAATAVDGKDGAWDAPASDEPLSKQAQHAKVRARGAALGDATGLTAVWFSAAAL